jgi:hypothetical protein
MTGANLQKKPLRYQIYCKRGPVVLCLKYCIFCTLFNQNANILCFIKDFVNTKPQQKQKNTPFF